jgi:hypothetical protein
VLSLLFLKFWTFSKFSKLRYWIGNKWWHWYSSPFLWDINLLSLLNCLYWQSKNNNLLSNSWTDIKFSKNWAELRSHMISRHYNFTDPENWSNLCWQAIFEITKRRKLDQLENVNITKTTNASLYRSIIFDHKKISCRGNRMKCEKDTQTLTD